jgi:hypothetical protein
MIVETAYDHDARRVTIGVDSTLHRVEAFQDRLAMALRASNLSSS